MDKGINLVGMCVELGLYPKNARNHAGMWHDLLAYPLALYKTAFPKSIVQLPWMCVMMTLKFHQTLKCILYAQKSHTPMLDTFPVFSLSSQYSYLNTYSKIIY